MANNVGKITQIISAVLDIKFTEGNLPEINEAIRVPLKDGKDFGITPRENKIWVEEYFKNFRNKHYSSSNNVHIKNKRKNKIDFLNKYYTQSQYSNDDPELEYVDKSVSSQTNSLNRKIE